MHHFIVVFALALCFKQLGEQQLVEQAKPCLLAAAVPLAK